MIYVIRDTLSSHIKIGYSNKPWRRLAMLQSGTPGELEMVAIFDGGLADEKALHQRFISERYRGEWFRADGLLGAWVEALPRAEKPSRCRSDRGLLLKQLVAATGVPTQTAYMWILRDSFPSRHWFKLIDAGILTWDELVDRARRHGRVSIAA